LAGNGQALCFGGDTGGDVSLSRASNWRHVIGSWPRVCGN
jgi:hypothetical protein